VLDFVMLDQDEAIGSTLRTEKAWYFISDLRRRMFRRPSGLEEKKTRQVIGTF
jgi:hypothetical protein